MINTDDLLRASERDAEAVKQYLVRMDEEELKILLDQFSPHEQLKKIGKKNAEDWASLVHLLMRAEISRFRTATRIIRLIWKGSSSEMENMQWLTEISLGYNAAMENCMGNHSMLNIQQTRKIKREVTQMLDAIIEFIHVAITEKDANTKALPHLMSLLPLFLSMLNDFNEIDGSLPDHATSNEILIQLIDLPWTSKTLPSLLDLVKETATMFSKQLWKHLRGKIYAIVEHHMKPEHLNGVIRECLQLANATFSQSEKGSSHLEWIDMARLLLRKLPLHMRHEAEFTIQTCLHQSQAMLSLLSESIARSFDNQSTYDCISSGIMRQQIAPSWEDLVLLLHILQASKPILNYRVGSSRLLRDAPFYETIERCILDLFVRESNQSQTDDKALAESVDKVVGKVLSFCGKQSHAREWKALLWTDLAWYWLETRPSSSMNRVTAINEKNELEEENLDEVQVAMSSSDELPTTVETDQDNRSLKLLFGRTVLLSVFRLAPEARAEVLTLLFDGSKSSQYTMRSQSHQAINELVRVSASYLHAHMNPIQDWLSGLFNSSFDFATDAFLMCSHLICIYPDFYNFQMIFFRKLLSSVNHRHHFFAVNIWCTWLEQNLALDVQQQEEIISALENAVLVCKEIRSTTLHRLRQLICRLNETDYKNRVSIQQKNDEASIYNKKKKAKNHPATTPKSSCLETSAKEMLHSLLTRQVLSFLSTIFADSHRIRVNKYYEEGESDNGSLYLTRTNFSKPWLSLESLYQQDPTMLGAQRVGRVFQEAILCLFAFDGSKPQSDQLREHRSLGKQSIRSSSGSSLLSISLLGMQVMEQVSAMVLDPDRLYQWILFGDDEVEDDFDEDEDEQAYFEKKFASYSIKTLSREALWATVARASLGSAYCALVMDFCFYRPQLVSKWQQVNHVENFSLWKLMDIFSCLHRLENGLVNHVTASNNNTSKKKRGRKPRVLAHTLGCNGTTTCSSGSGSGGVGGGGLSSSTSVQVGLISSGLDSIHALLRRNMIKILDAISLQIDPKGSSRSSEDTTATTAAVTSMKVLEGRVSFESILCCLDACRGPLDLVSMDSTETNSANLLLESLLHLFKIVLDESQKEKDLGDDLFWFTCYSEEVMSKFPKNLRTIMSNQAANGISTNTMVGSSSSSLTAGNHGQGSLVLDDKNADEVLSRICTSISKLLEQMMMTTAISSTVVFLSSKKTTMTTTSLDSFETLGLGFLCELKTLISVKGASTSLNKTKLACGLLSKRFLEVSKKFEHSKKASSVAAEVAATIAYNVLCDHNVYQPALLRILLSFCFGDTCIDMSSSSSSGFLKVTRRVVGILQACGFEIDTEKLNQIILENRRVSIPKKKKSKSRKRLRQQVNNTENEAEVEEDGVEDDTTPGVETEEQEQVEFSPLVAESLPILSSESQQVMSIQFVLTFFETSHMTVLRSMTTNSSQTFGGFKILLIHEIFINSLFLSHHRSSIKNSMDLRWLSSKITTKFINCVEISMRMGKFCLSKWKQQQLCLPIEIVFDIFQSSIRLTMQYREWFSFVKHFLDDARIKSKFSALTLKVDIFILDIPSMMDTLMKELTRQSTVVHCTTTMAETRKKIHEKLKSFSSQVIMEIASFQTTDKKTLNQNTKSKTKRAKKRQQKALRVVPILKKRRKRLRSRHAYIDECLRDENGEDAYADLEDFIEC